MEGHQAVAEDEGEKGSSAAVSSSGPPAPVNVGSRMTCESVIENKGVAMASNDVSSALSSPAEASPAKPAVPSPTTFEGITPSSPAVSGMASASDSLTINGASQLSHQSCVWPPSTVFGDPNNEKNFPSVLTFKGVSVTLENHSVWKQFYSCGTEMILTKQGRRMFPYCRYRLKGLDPCRRYTLVLSIVPSDQFKYRWNSTTWEVIAQAENQCQGLVRAFSHHNSPSLGLEWMSGLVSFYRLKITNNPHGWQDDHMVLHSMHRYVPRLNVIPVPDGQLATPDQPFVKGPESMTFTFPQTEFMAVTTYQNFRITQLKITYNPFAKGFREDGGSCRLDKLGADAQPAVKKDPDQKPAERVHIKEEAVDLSMKRPSVPASPASALETRLVLKPIMSKASKDDPQAIKIIRHDAGKRALGDLVLVQRALTFEPKEEKHPVCVTPTLRQYVLEAPKALPVTPVSSRSTPASSQGYAKRRKRMNRRWAKSLGKASPAGVVRSPSLSVSMQPEVDDVEGLLFASFISKEALEIHVGDKLADGSASASLVAKDTRMRCEPTAEERPESVDETIAGLEAMLLQDLKVLKHRQVIHPVLQEVGLKLSSLDQSKSIDLQYLGVRLPLPATVHPQQNHHGGSAPSCGADKGLPFISRTGKTSDVTKIKGWKNKFISSKETSKCDGPQKDLSAFCSNMLDEYLESEAQQISERAAAFSASPEGAVAYQLPAKSSSYVKTLDSVLKRNAAAKSLRRANRPCPLSHKPLLYSTLVSPAPPLSRPASRVKAEIEPVREFVSGQTQEKPTVPAKSPPPGPNATAFTPPSPVSPRLFMYQQKPAASFGQSHGATSKPAVLSKVQIKLLEMEMAAVNQGVSQTRLTTERLSVALSVLLTAKMQFNQHLSAPLQLSSEGPACGQAFCRLGCVCSSILRPVRAITDVEHILQPSLGVAKLWNRNSDAPDTEPLFAPKIAVFPVSSKVQNHSHRPRPKQPIREEDKDPVYKYFENMMTCARVRQFNRKSPPEVTPEPRDPVTSTPIVPKEPKTTTTKNPPKNFHGTILAIKHSGKSSPGAQSSDTEAKTQVEIQSACQWDKDHKVVLEALCLRMNQNRLSQRFFVGPYHIRPVSKIHVRKPSGSVITYRVHISKPMRDSDDDDEEEEESDVSDEENISDVSADGDPDEKEEFSPAEEPEMKFGVTPFLSSVLPAGSLKATKKTAGCQASGLVQVNGKSYNQAKLLLGNMGSLHPANRLAAYLTGRLRIPRKLKTIEKTKAAHKLAAPGVLQIQTAGSLAPSSVTARKTSDLKTPQQPAVSSAPQWQQLPPPPTTSPSTPFVSNQSSFLRSFQNRSPSSGVLLTVSPSLKTPGFLAERGTYSFRICPPSGHSTKGQNLPGVTLPGGFTLIDLPKPGGHTPPALTGNAANTATNGARPQRDDLFRSDRLPANSGAAELDLATDHGDTRVLDRLSVSSAELTCDESDDAQRRPTGLEESNASESSDSSDYREEDEDEPVDVETVEEIKQNLAIVKMWESVKGDVKQEFSRISSVDFDSAERLMLNQKDGEESRGSRRPLNHTVGERYRRFQQRFLFNKLKALLKCDARASKVALLTLAIHEIQTLVKASACLEQKKKMLIEMQSGYLRKISILSGKSGELIKNKLMEICNKQKLREQSASTAASTAVALTAATSSSFCPRLPRHKSAHLQVDAQQPKSCLKSQSWSEGLTVPQTSAQTLGPGVSPPAPDKVLAPHSKPEDQRETPAASSQAAARMSSDTAGAQVTSAQPGPSPQTFTYPLVRSKTGRIILPSSLKSPMQGLYKLMVMKGEQSESSSPQAKSQERSVPEPAQRSDSGSSRGEDYMASPLSMIARLNKSISSVSVVMQHASMERDTLLGLDKTVATYGGPVSAPSAPPVSRRGRGRPRKDVMPVTPGGGNEKLRAVEKADKEAGGEPTGAVERTETDAEGTPGNIGEGEDDSVPAKRGRGRPPKRKKRPEDEGWRETSAGTEPKHKTPAMQTGSGRLVVSPVRWPRSVRSPKDGPATNLLPGGVAASRPLTRGALGKDFPSAKKRSWIDVEKELEQETE